MRNKLILVLIVVVFSLGWVANTLLANLIYYDAEKAFPFSFSPFMSAPEQLSPSDHVTEDQIHVMRDRIVLDVRDATWASFTDTNSMDPFMDEYSNSIEIKPAAESDVQIGDIISYRSSIQPGLIVHRVVNKGNDEAGNFFIVKGDNNAEEDPEKVRFDQIHGVLIGIIY